MSYVDEVIELVEKKNPGEPEFHQAVREVLESLKPVVEANEEKYRKAALLERLVTVQQRHRTIQGRTEIPSFCISGNH